MLSRLSGPDIVWMKALSAWADTTGGSNKMIKIREGNTFIHTCTYPEMFADWTTHTDSHTVRTAVITWTGTHLSVAVDGSTVISNLAVDHPDAFDADGYAWVGFSARSGGNLEIHDVVSFEMEYACTDTTACDNPGEPEDVCSKGAYQCVRATTSPSACAALGWPADKGADANVCGESNLSVFSEADNCSGPMGHGSAATKCAEAGGRLCTLDELLNDETAGTGCGYDAERVWSATPCEEGRFWSAPGNSSNLDTLPIECRPQGNGLRVRCCADADPWARPASCRPTDHWDCSDKFPGTAVGAVCIHDDGCQNN